MSLKNVRQAIEEKCFIAVSAETIVTKRKSDKNFRVECVFKVKARVSILC